MKKKIQELALKKSFDPEDRKTLDLFLDDLESGRSRAAACEDGVWRVNRWVKSGLLAGFRMGILSDQSIDSRFRFFDKDTFPLRVLTLTSGVRLVPGGSAIRRGAFVAAGVTCMPPMYINVGAFVDEGTMIDSHVLVGSCAQIGKHVHLSAAAQIGGVLEPVGALPVIVEDEVLVGGNCGVYEGTIVRRGAVLAPGVILTRSTGLYDLVNRTTYSGTKQEPLVVPPRAVVVPGGRRAAGDFAGSEGISLYCPVIVKYRDDRTERSVRLEDELR